MHFLLNDMICLKRGDCLELMKEIPDKSIDMILCDLPFGQTARNKWDSVIPFDLVWKQYNRIIKDNGAIVLFANGMFTADLMQSIATGVRWDESRQRKDREEFEKLGATKATKEKFTSVMLMNDNDARRRMNEHCMQKNKMVVNPIIDWKHSDIWEYINSEGIHTCELYQCGYERVGCIGCPMAGKKRYKEFADFPKYKNLYIHAFDRMVKERKSRGLPCQWKNGNDAFLWWMEDENIEGQMDIFDFIGGTQ